MVWDFQLETRFPGIDEDHRELDNLLMALQSACTTSNKTQVAAALKAYIVRTERHFDFEARLMAAVGDRSMHDHKSAHAAYVAEMERYAAQLEKGGLTDLFRRWATTQLGDWFRAHVKAYDAALVRQLEEYLRSGAELPRKG